MNFFRKVYKVFIEGWKSRKTFLYKDNYEAMKNGTTHTGFPEIDKYFHVIEKCIELVQEKLKTFLFNDIKKSRWIQFDEILNSFRNMCMNIETYEKTCEMYMSDFKNFNYSTNL